MLSVAEDRGRQADTGTILLITIWFDQGTHSNSWITILPFKSPIWANEWGENKKTVVLLVLRVSVIVANETVYWVWQTGPHLLITLFVLGWPAPIRSGAKCNTFHTPSFHLAIHPSVCLPLLSRFRRLGHNYLNSYIINWNGISSAVDGWRSVGFLSANLDQGLAPRSPSEGPTDRMGW